MKLSTAKEHRDFFHKNGWIEFEEFLSNENLAQTGKAVDQVLSERLKTSEAQLRFISPEMLFLQGRDLWRSSPSLHKLAAQVRFAEIASELIEKKPLRLGYDQLIPAPAHMQSGDGREAVYAHFLEQPAALESVSCLKGVLCGLIWALDDLVQNVEEAPLAEGIDIFPKKGGNAIYFKPDVLINWKALYSHPGQRFYMVVYTSAFSLYILQPQDPHTHSLKRLGYIFNDKLNDRLHPIVYR